MKKVLLMVFAMVFLFTSAFAESFNYPDLTDDALLEIYNSARQELITRGILAGLERTLREGKYIIGKDIPAGNYTITCISTAGESAGDVFGALGGMMDAADDSSADWGNLYGSFGGLIGDYINMSAEIIGDYGDVLHSYSMKNGDSFVITLEEGTALKISDGSCTIVSEE